MRLDLSLKGENYSQWFGEKEPEQTDEVSLQEGHQVGQKGGTRHCSDWGQHPLLNPACDDTPRKSCQVQSLTQQTGNSEDPCGSRDELGEFTGVSRTKQLEFCRVLGQQKTHLKIQGKDLHDLVSGCHHFLIHDPEAKAVWESHKRPGGRKPVKLCPCSQFLTPPVGISC